MDGSCNWVYFQNYMQISIYKGVVLQRIGWMEVLSWLDESKLKSSSPRADAINNSAL